MWSVSSVVVCCVSDRSPIQKGPAALVVRVKGCVHPICRAVVVACMRVGELMYLVLVAVSACDHCYLSISWCIQVKEVLH